MCFVRSACSFGLRKERRDVQYVVIGSFQAAGTYSRNPSHLEVSTSRVANFTSSSLFLPRRIADQVDAEFGGDPTDNTEQEPSESGNDADEEVGGP